MATKKKKSPVNFFVWLRSGLRSMSRRYPPIFEALAAARIPYKGDNKRRKYSYICAECNGEFDSKNVAVDHKLPTGTLTKWEDVMEFMRKLFCDSSGLQVLCKKCHDIKSYMEKQGCTKEEAIIEKRAIEICKLPKSKILAILKENGYNGASVSNTTKRRKIITELLRKGDIT